LIGNGWKIAVLALVLFIFGFAVLELRDFGVPSGEPADLDYNDVQDLGPDGNLTWDPESGQIEIYDELTGQVIRQNRTMMDDEFLDDAVDPQGTVNSNNVVTAIVFDYRGFDTLGEATVLFAAVTGVLTTIRIAFPGKKGKKGGGSK
jgi:hypothetical protein